MSLFADKLRLSRNPLIDKLRGLTPPKEELVFPEPAKPVLGDDVKNEVMSLKEKKVPLRKVLKGIESLGLDESAKDFAKQIYFGLVEPLTKVKSEERNPDFTQQGEQMAKGVSDFLSTAKQEIPKVVDTTLNLPGDLAQEKLLNQGSGTKTRAGKKLAAGVGLALNIISPGPGEFKGNKGFITPKTAIAAAGGLTVGAGLLALEGKVRRDGYLADKKNAEKMEAKDIMAAKNELEIAKMFSDIQLLEDGENKDDLLELLNIRYGQLSKK